MSTTEATRHDPYQIEAAMYDVLWAGLNRLDLPFYLDVAQEYGGPMLELGCGTGRVLLPCLKAVGAAVGVDLSPAMLAAARARIADEDLGPGSVEVVEGDLRTVRLGRRFPLVIMAGQPLFHLRTDADWEAALATVREHLAPGGRWVTGVPVPRFDEMSRYSERQYFVGEIRHPQTNERIAIWDHNDFDTAQQSITRRRVTETLDEDGVVLRRQHNLNTNYYRYPGEVRRLVAAAGLHIEHEYGGYDRQPFGPASEHLVWIATADPQPGEQHGSA